MLKPGKGFCKAHLQIFVCCQRGPRISFLLQKFCKLVSAIRGEHEEILAYTYFVSLNQSVVSCDRSSICRIPYLQHGYVGFIRMRLRLPGSFFTSPL